MNKDLVETLYKYLPKDYVDKNLQKSGDNGEELAVDEACVWKRILDFRLASKVCPKTILETHAGLGVATELYRLASPLSEIVSCRHFQSDIPESSIFDFIDIDPFGQPYEALDYAKAHSNKYTVWQITNGEILQVSRNLKGVKLVSEYKGKECYKWVENVYIPYLEKDLQSKCVWYYIFPTSVRVVLSNLEIPKEVFECCPKYMSWISKYAVNERRRLF